MVAISWYRYQPLPCAVIYSKLAVRCRVRLARGPNKWCEAAPFLSRASYLFVSRKTKAQAEAVEPDRTRSAGISCLCGGKVLRTANGWRSKLQVRRVKFTCKTFEA